MNQTHFIPTNRSPWLVITRKNNFESWRWHDDIFRFRSMARIRAFWLRAKGLEVRVVRAWVPTN